MTAEGSTAVPSLLRRMNEQQIIRVLQSRGEASRADLSRATGVSYPTVSRIVGNLIEANILEEGDVRYLSLGRPARTLRIARNSVQVLGANIGPGYCEVFSAGLDGEIHEASTRRFATPSTYPELVCAIAENISPLIDARGVPTLGVGITAPGVLNYRDHRVAVSPAIHQLDGHALGEDLREKLALNAIVVQSMHAVFLAERMWGLARDVEDFALVGIASGVGLALCSRGRLIAGHNGLAGELGHLLIDPHGMPCGCGKRGCLETAATDIALAAAASQRLGRTVDINEAVTLVRSGELELRAEVDRMVRYLATGLAAVINLLNPEYVFIYGRCLDVEEGAFARLVEQTAERALDPLMAECKIVRVERRIREGAIAAIIQHLTGQLAFDVL